MDKKKKKHQVITNKELVDIRDYWFNHIIKDILRLQEEAWNLGVTIDTIGVPYSWLMGATKRLNEINTLYGKTKIVYNKLNSVSPIDKVNIR